MYLKKRAFWRNGVKHGYISIFLGKIPIWGEIELVNSIKLTCAFERKGKNCIKHHKKITQKHYETPKICSNWTPLVNATLRSIPNAYHLPKNWPERKKSQKWPKIAQKKGDFVCQNSKWLLKIAPKLKCIKPTLKCKDWGTIKFDLGFFEALVMWPQTPSKIACLGIFKKMKNGVL